jgi:F-box-like
MTPCKHCGFPEDINPGQSNTSGDLRRELEDLDSHITRVETLLRQLRGKAVGLKKTINQHSSPVLQLPPEVIADIFEACLPAITWPSNVHPRRKTVPNATMPFVIGKVCSAWRQLAWLTPKLWSRISLLLEDCTSKDCELLEEWLLRSGRSPLSIHLTFDKDGAAAGDATRSILHTIADCSERWRDIYFALPASLYEPLNPIRDRLPLLTTLSLFTRILDVGERNFQHFSAAPRLRHVEMYGYGREWMNISLDHVTKLSFSVVGIAHCMETLRCFPDLSHCTFKYMFLGREPLFPTLVSKVNLKYLEFVMNSMELLSMFIDLLDLPVVQELRIDMCRVRLPHSSLISLLSRSGCSLQRLVLAKCFCGAEELRALFGAIGPSLIELEVNNCTISGGGILELLDLSKNVSATMLPNLQALKLVDQAGTDLSDLESMILSRWQNATSSDSRNNMARFSSIAAIWNVTVGPQAKVDRLVLAQLQQLIGEGMEISIRDRDTIIF